MMTSYHWGTVSELSSEFIELSHVEDLPSDRPALVVEITYSIPGKASQFTPNFFLDPLNLEALSGVKYIPTLVPNQFQTSYSPYPKKWVNSLSKITFPKASDQLNRAFKVRSGPEDLIIRQVNGPFNDFLLKVEMLTVIQKDTDNLLTIHVRSIAILDEMTSKSSLLSFYKRGMELKMILQARESYQVFSRRAN